MPNQFEADSPLGNQQPSLRIAGSAYHRTARDLMGVVCVPHRPLCAGAARSTRTHGLSAPLEGGVPYLSRREATGMAKQATKRAATAEAAGPVEPVDLGMLETYIAYYLRNAQDATFRAYARRTGKLDVRPGVYSAMEVIANNPGITASALGRAIARDKSTVTPLIQYLQRQSLITRTISAEDRRRIHLGLTNEGQRTLKVLRQHAAQHEAELDAIVGSAKPRIIKLLKLIADTLNT